MLSRDPDCSGKPRRKRFPMVRTIVRPPADYDKAEWRRLHLQMLAQRAPAVFRSAGAFLWGIARRFYALVPGAVVGLISYYGTLRHRAVFVSPSLAGVLLIGGCLAAAIAEYHSVRSTRDQLAQQPKVILNKQLNEARDLREEIARGVHEDGLARVKTAAWQYITENRIRERTPEYLTWWQEAHGKAQGAGNAQLVASLDNHIDALARISRDLRNG